MEIVKEDLSGGPRHYSPHRKTLYHMMKKKLPEFEKEIETIRKWMMWYQANVGKGYSRRSWNQVVGTKEFCTFCAKETHREPFPGCPYPQHMEVYLRVKERELPSESIVRISVGRTKTKV